MQRHDLSDGSAVIHRIEAVTGSPGSFLSAWFDADGNLMDCEKFTRTRRVVRASEADKERARRAYRYTGKIQRLAESATPTR